MNMTMFQLEDLLSFSNSVHGKRTLIAGIVVTGCLALLLAEVANPEQKKTTQPRSSSTVVLARHDEWPTPIEKVPPLALPDGRLAVAAGDMVYMLARNNSVLWSQSVRMPITKQALRADLSEVAVIGYDNTFCRLDATVGKLVWCESMQGRAGFADIKAFRSGYVVLVDLSGYRAWPGGFGAPESDQLRYYGTGDDDYWDVAFPVGAQLAVTTKKIYAVKFRKNNIALQEIRIPPPGSR